MHHLHLFLQTIEAIFTKDKTSSQETCRCPHWHRLALKLGCAELILLVLSLTGLSILVRVLVQKPPIKKCSVSAQEVMAEPTGTPPWYEGLADCSVRGATLLLIEDQEELRYFQNFSKREGHQFYIGLKYMQVEQIWKWTNGSTLNPDLLQVTGKDKENSCAVISQTGVFSDSCFADSRWVCQKKLKHV
ncbi:killer cell lectin-like receptor subfamily B member 1F [Alexandromys fortis]|uniref:killer cell lectin-like receptor subfamily B member 1F n=1 Tax=Alexandromys fortis TaxID=100897 RepID=UPI002152C712|nr:killer cell lectin-like receptor subfamily B member 1F [Microtus fortis]